MISSNPMYLIPPSGKTAFAVVSCEFSHTEVLIPT